MTYRPFYINLPFEQFEIWRDNAIRWNLDFKKLDKGEFWCEMSMIDFGQVQISRTYVTSTLAQTGLTPVGYRTFCISADKNQNFGWLRRSITCNDLLAFPNDGTIDGYSIQGFHVYTIAIKNELLNNLVQKKQSKDAEERLKMNEFALNINFNRLQYLRSLISMLFETADRNANSIYSESFARAVLERLPELIIVYLSDSDLLDFEKQVKKTDAILFQSMGYIHNNINIKTNIQKLCSDLNISKRTLEYAYQTRIGISPANFSKAIKLNSFRKELTNTKRKTTISDIASKYGFTHMGQLSADYKAHFGELPRDTFKSLELN